MTKLLGCFAGMLAVVLLLSDLPAQDKKVEQPNVKGKANVKAKDAGDAAKDDDEPKKDPKPAKDKKEEKHKGPELVYGKTLTCKVKKVEANSNRDFTVEYPVVDQKKVYDLQVWQAQQQNSLAQQYKGVLQAKGVQAYQQALLNYNRSLANFQMEAAKRKDNIYTNQDLDVRLAEAGKVRSTNPPVKYDDRGFPIQYNKKDLEKLKGNSKLPGYPVEGEGLEDLKQGLSVQLYLAKGKAGNVPDKKAKKIKLDDDDMATTRPEVVLILIQADK
jgi:hypothetical protein